MTNSLQRKYILHVFTTSKRKSKCYVDLNLRWKFSLCRRLICSEEAEVELCGKHQNKWDPVRKHQFFGNCLAEVATNRKVVEEVVLDVDRRGQHGLGLQGLEDVQVPAANGRWKGEWVRFWPKNVWISVSGQSHPWIHGQCGSGGDVHWVDPPEVSGKTPIGGEMCFQCIIRAQTPSRTNGRAIIKDLIASRTTLEGQLKIKAAVRLTTIYTRWRQFWQPDNNSEIFREIFRSILNYQSSGVSVPHTEEEEKERPGNDGELEHGTSHFDIMAGRGFWYGWKGI